MNEAKYVRSEFIRLKTFFCLILSDLERGDKAEIDAYAFSEMLVARLKQHNPKNKHYDF
jgi:hypothetical protein